MLPTSELTRQRASATAAAARLVSQLSPDDPLAGLALTAAAAGEVAPRPIRRLGSRLLARVRRDGRADRAFDEAFELLVQYPADEHLQRVVASLIAQTGDRSLAEASWRGVLGRQPGSPEAFASLFDLLLRRGGIARAAALTWLLDRPEGAGDPAAQRLLGLARERLGDRVGAERAFESSLATDPSSALAWLRASALARARGAEGEARQLAKQGLAATGDKRLQRPAPPPPSPPRVRQVAEGWEKPLAKLIRLGQAVRTNPAQQPGALGRTVLIGGSLGGGGAERQLVRTALALARLTGDVAGGMRGPVSVICRRLDARGGHDFFLPALEAAGVPVSPYLTLPVFGRSPARSLLAEHKALVQVLPTRMREGTERLTDHLAALAPDVVQIWQDGMILACGLAALLARVPRIVLNVRTLPPSERADRWRPEAEQLFRGLLASPGVVLTANSGIAARAYESWLDLPRGLVAVVPNGVDPLPIGGSDTAAAILAEFERRARGSFTVGGIMRMDANKRPLDWLAVAERLLQQRPDARFILVGDGELGPVARDFAAQRGLADRVLFVGRSPEVGFWLSHMDALLLTSRYEGTPNVLIEAQLAGVPIVSTPAGAAQETFVPDVTGFLLSAAEDVDVEEAAGRLDTIAGWSPTHRRDVGRLARHHATHAYGGAAMVRTTIETFQGAAL